MELECTTTNHFSFVTPSNQKKKKKIHYNEHKPQFDLPHYEKKISSDVHI